MKTPIQFLTISLILFLVSIVLVNSSDHTAYACSCMQPLSPDAELPNYDAVFSGRVIENQDVSATQQTDSIFFIFDVDKIWKGDKKDTVTVKTAESSAACGFPFEENQEYIVYANQYDGDYLEVSLCSRTGLLADATEDLQELDSGFSIESKLLSPLKQIKNGVSVDEIQCKDNLQLVIKHDSTPACLKSESIQKLDERGWILAVASTL